MLGLDAHTLGGILRLAATDERYLGNRKNNHMQQHPSSVIEGNRTWKVILTPTLAAIGAVAVAVGLSQDSVLWRFMLIGMGLVWLVATFFLLRRISRGMHRL